MATRYVYLAGPIAGLTWIGATYWRNEVTLGLGFEGIQTLDPMRNHFEPEQADEILTPISHERNLFNSPRGMVTRDKNDIKRSDAVLVNLLGASRVSIGTMIEMGWADAMDKPIVTVIPTTDVLHNHPFVTELSQFVVNDMYDAIEILRSLLYV